MSTREHEARVPGDVLLHPCVLFALAVWFINDHVLKHAVPSWLTGKLSDFACLVVCPLLVLAAVELLQPQLSERARRMVLAAAIAGFAAIMISINLFDAAAWAYRWGLGLAQWPVHALVALVSGAPAARWSPVSLTMDPSDLISLPSLVIPALLGARRREGARVCFRESRRNRSGLRLRGPTAP